MTVARLVPALALGMLPLLAQTTTNPVNVDQVVTLQANLSSLNETPPVFTTTGTGGTTATTNTISTGTARITIRFIGSNSTNVNPVTGTPLPVTGTTSSVSRATVTISLSPNFVGNETITSAQIVRGATGVAGSGTGNATVFDFNLPASTPITGGAAATPVNNQFDVTSATQLANLREIVNNPSAFYLNISTQSNATGMLRGQLRRAGDTADDLTGSRLDLVTRLVVRIAYQEGVITLAERDAYLATLPVVPTPGANATNP